MNAQSFIRTLSDEQGKEKEGKKMKLYWKDLESGHIPEKYNSPEFDKISGLPEVIRHDARVRAGEEMHVIQKSELTDALTHFEISPNEYQYYARLTSEMELLRMQYQIPQFIYRLQIYFSGQCYHFAGKIHSDVYYVYSVNEARQFLNMSVDQQRKHELVKELRLPFKYAIRNMRDFVNRASFIELQAKSSIAKSFDVSDRPICKSCALYGLTEKSKCLYAFRCTFFENHSVPADYRERIDDINMEDYNFILMFMDCFKKQPAEP